MMLKNYYCQFWRTKLAVSTVSLTFLLTYPLSAQIIPDNSLGSENSIVTPNVTVKDTLADLIEGGAIRGNNLFHSFSQFNVNNGGNVYFANPDGVANILTRVTGNNTSEIFGTLGIDGTANLFLLNPNGIVFGENAALDVNGSFFATTADSYIFENGFTYSASNPEVPPLLTINLPVGVQFGNRAESITNLSQVVEPETDSVVGLQVPSGQSLTLLGGDIIFDSGNLKTAGKVELGSVNPESLVNLELDRGIVLDYGNNQNFQDIHLRNLAKVEADDDIHVEGRQIVLTEGSQIRSNTTDNNPKSKLTVRASEKLELLGVGENNTSSGLQKTNLQSQAIDGGDGINIETSQLIIRDGAQIVTTVLGDGNAGDIQINAQDIEITSIPESFIPTSITMVTFGKGKAGNLKIATQRFFLDLGLVSSVPFGEGNGGNVEVEADNLSLINGAQIQSGALVGSGNGGDLTIKTKTLDISGVTPFNIDPETNRPTLEDRGGKALTGLFASVNTRSTGNAGNIFVQTDRMAIYDGGVISTNTDSIGNSGDIIIQAQNIEVRDTFFAFNGSLSGIRATVDEGAVGAGGDITINSENLRVLAGGQINAFTLGEGDAGNITLNVQNLQIKGISETEKLQSRIAAFSKTDFAAGSIDINANALTIDDQAEISVNNTGNGNAGNLNITTTDLFLDQSGKLLAEVNSGDQGNISLTTDNVFLRNNSEINAKATGTATGGNITINNTDNIVLLNNSQIIADAIEGNGGNINITTQGLFVSPDSLISASSEFGLDGNVEIKEVNGDRKFEFNQLPENIRDLTNLITVTCSAKEKNAVAVMGNGGIPKSPYQAQSLNTTWYDLRPVKQGENEIASQPAPLTEATTTMIDANGELALVALTPLSTHRWVNSSCSN